jgi:hypothetical protein
MPDRIAYLPLDGQNDSTTDPAILAAVAVGAAFGCKLHVTNFTVDVPPVASPLGGFMINIEGMARAAEERARAECQRRKAVIEAAPVADCVVAVTIREIAMGGVMGAAAVEARQFDLSLVPVPADGAGPQDMAQALVFDSGLPVILVPETAKAAPLDHIAVAWDGSRVAARALNDALHLLAPGGRVTVLTVHGEKGAGAGRSCRKPCGHAAASRLRRQGGEHRTGRPADWRGAAGWRAGSRCRAAGDGGLRSFAVSRLCPWWRDAWHPVAFADAGAAVALRRLPFGPLNIGQTGC